MRRAILLVLAMLMLGMAFAGPATAVPYPHPEASTWRLTCEGMEPFDVMSPWLVPGWRPEGGPPILYFGGEWTFYENNVAVETFVDPSPPGLMARLTPCHITGPLEVNPLAFRAEADAYFLFLSH